VVEGVADAAYGAAVVLFFDQIQVCVLFCHVFNN
jgi:hypothetical protein